MPQHRADFQVPNRPLGKSDIVFRVYEDDELYGTLKVSFGALDWIPANAPHSMPYRITWDRFDAFAKEKGYRIRPED